MLLFDGDAGVCGALEEHLDEAVFEFSDDELSDIQTCYH